MRLKSPPRPAGISIGIGSGIGGGLGLVFALLIGAEVPLGLVFGAGYRGSDRSSCRVRSARHIGPDGGATRDRLRSPPDRKWAHWTASFRRIGRRPRGTRQPRIRWRGHPEGR